MVILQRFATDINNITGLTAGVDELNILDGVTVLQQNWMFLKILV